MLLLLVARGDDHIDRRVAPVFGRRRGVASGPRIRPMALRRALGLKTKFGNCAI